MKEKFDNSVLKEIIGVKDGDFFIIDNAFSSFSDPSKNIIVIYRTPLEERIVIDRVKYNAVVLSKQRNNKLNQIL